MKYAKRNSTGDAGEYFFAYKISTVLGWPCRLLDIDIGIDAQIEVLDKSLNSTGQFIAAQVKATNGKSSDSIYVNAKHIKYWQSIESGVLIALVDLKTEEIFIKEVERGHAYPKAKPGGNTCKIQFNRRTDRLTKKLAQRLRRLAFAFDAQQIEKMIEEIERECAEILFDTDLDKDLAVQDSNHYLEMIERLEIAEKKVFEVKIRVQLIYKNVGDCGYESILGKLLSARKSLSDFLDDWNLVDHDFALIKNFKNEHDNIRQHLALD